MSSLTNAFSACKFFEVNEGCWHVNISTMKTKPRVKHLRRKHGRSAQRFPESKRPNEGTESPKEGTNGRGEVHPETIIRAPQVMFGFSRKDRADLRSGKPASQQVLLPADRSLHFGKAEYQFEGLCNPTNRTMHSPTTHFRISACRVAAATQDQGGLIAH